MKFRAHAEGHCPGQRLLRLHTFGLTPLFVILNRFNEGGLQVIHGLYGKSENVTGVQDLSVKNAGLNVDNDFRDVAIITQR